MDTKLLDVLRFSAAFRMTVNGSPCNLPKDKITERSVLMAEELAEYVEAAHRGDKAEILDALVDLQYVLCGTVVAHGMQLVFDEAFSRVHEANMKKKSGVNAKRAEWLKVDVVKPADWQPPNLEDLV